MKHVHIYTYYIQKHKLSDHSFAAKTGRILDIHTTMLTLGPLGAH